jgi:hypothetical protein
MELENKTLENSIAEIILANKELIKESAMRTLNTAVADNLSWNIRDMMKSAVDDFITTEIMPEIKTLLTQNKQVFLDQLIAAVSEIGTELAKHMVEKAVKNMSNSWEFEKVTKALFN